MSPLDAQVLRHLERRSKQAAVLAGSGAVILFGVLGISAAKLYGLQQDIEESRQRKQTLELEIRKLIDVKEELEKEKQALEKFSEVAFQGYQNTLKLATKSAASARAGAPITAVAVPRAFATNLPGEANRYGFVLETEVPRNRWPEIEKVTYYFNHPSFQTPLLESQDPRSHYQVKYQGWGALRRVLITIHLRNGESPQLAFDMAEAINRSRGEPRTA